MNDVTDAIAVAILNRLIALTPNERKKVMHMILYNDMFCVYCGQDGECYCQNDD